MKVIQDFLFENKAHLSIGSTLFWGKNLFDGHGRAAMMILGSQGRLKIE